MVRAGSLTGRRGRTPILLARLSRALGDITVERDRGVALITLNRPEKRNAYRAQMGAELGAAYRACDADDEIRAVVLTGAPPAFCAGADLSRGEGTFVRADDAFTAAAFDPPAWAIRKP